MKNGLKILIVIVFLLLVVYVLVDYNVDILKQNETININQDIQRKSNNFIIDKIIAYSNVEVKDAENNQKSYWKLTISQFTDFAVYIKSNSNIQNDETKIKQVFVENLNVNTKPEIGNPVFQKISLNDFAKQNLIQKESVNNIEYKVIDNNTNIDNTKLQFKNNGELPLCFRYYNKEIEEDFLIQDISLPLNIDGSILKRANIRIDSIKSQISFDVKIINSLDEVYTANIQMNLPISNEIYNGKQTAIYDVNKNFV